MSPYIRKNFVSIYFTFSYFFFCVTRKHFRSSLKLEFSSSSSSCAHTNVLTVRTTHQSALMRWHMCDFYKIIRKCHLLSKKHSRFIQSLPVQFIEETQNFFLLDSFCLYAHINWIIIIIYSSIHTWHQFIAKNKIF